MPFKKSASLLMASFLAGMIAAASFGQIESTAETKFRVDGIDGYQQLAGIILAPKGSNPSLTPVGIVNVDRE